MNSITTTVGVLIIAVASGQEAPDWGERLARLGGVGYFGLGKLTAVTYAESHDGPWWRQWWQTNRARFPVEVRRLEIPTLAEP